MQADQSQRTFVTYHSNALLLKLGRFVWQMHILSAILLTYVLNSVVVPQLLWPWAGWMTVFGLAQAYICFHGAARADANAPLDRISTAFDATAILLALGWGWLGFMLLPTDDTELRTFVGFIISGGVLTGTGTHNMRYPILVLTLSIIMFAQAARTYLDNPDGQRVIAAGMLVLFLLLMLGLGWVLRGFTRRGFVLQWEKMQLADALETARAEAENANRAKSRFLAQASHDLRQPIHAMGLLLASQSETQLTPETHHVFERLKQSVEILSKLFTSLLDVTLLDTQQIRPNFHTFSLGDLINDIITEFSPAAIAAGCGLRAEAGNTMIESDPLIVRRVLQNLVSNAIRHGEGTDILVTTEQSGRQFTLLVRDWGPGIHKEEQARIFEAFQKGSELTDASEGVGLGLAIVQRLAELAGARVSVASKAGEGATFRVGPFDMSDRAAAVPESDPEKLKMQDQPGRALIIDDDRSTLEATGDLLSSWGWSVDLRDSLSSDEMESLFRPDLIICDYDLRRNQTGLQLIKVLQEKFPGTPALIMTGSSSPETAKQIRQTGLLVLLKPVRPVQLRSALISLAG
ncbi:hybrid sensor histidine kinase/response regulator [Hyphomonas sp.]|uniref:hybrid sensor histidine kinase/response regulator n=1 Tax=Hyphomonas sp. TaxID=87 RepID=UPI003F6FA5CB